MCDLVGYIVNIKERVIDKYIYTLYYKYIS